MDILQVQKYYLLIKLKARFTYSPSGNVLEKWTKITEDQERKQINALKVLKPNTQQLTIKNAILEDQQIKKAKMKLN